MALIVSPEIVSAEQAAEEPTFEVADEATKGNILEPEINEEDIVHVSPIVAILPSEPSLAMKEPEVKATERLVEEVSAPKPSPQKVPEEEMPASSTTPERTEVSEAAVMDESATSLMTSVAVMPTQPVADEAPEAPLSEEAPLVVNEAPAVEVAPRTPPVDTMAETPEETSGVIVSAKGKEKVEEGQPSDEGRICNSHVKRSQKGIDLRH